MRNQGCVTETTEIDIEVHTSSYRIKLAITERIPDIVCFQINSEYNKFLTIESV